VPIDDGTASANLAALPGVEDAVAMIGTSSNLELMRAAGLLAPSGEAAGPNDLVLAVRAADEAAAEAAFAHARIALEREVAPAADGDWRPRTLDGALDRMADANLVLISTPGACAAREARRALDRGLNVIAVSFRTEIRANRAGRVAATTLVWPNSLGRALSWRNYGYKTYEERRRCRRRVFA